MGHYSKTGVFSSLLFFLSPLSIHIWILRWIKHMNCVMAIKIKTQWMNEKHWKKWYWLDDNNNKSLLCDKINPFFSVKNVMKNRSMWPLFSLCCCCCCCGLAIVHHYLFFYLFCFFGFLHESKYNPFFSFKFLIGRFFKYIDDLSNWRKILFSL